MIIGPPVPAESTAQSQQFVIRTPPYDFQWSQPGYYGFLFSNNNVYADRNSGQMGFSALTGVFTTKGSGYGGTAALGIFIHPEGPGFLQTWSSPQFYYSWDIEATIGTCSSSASIGLYLARFTLDGRFVGEALGGPNDSLTDNLWYQSIYNSIGGARDQGSSQEAIYKGFFVDSNHNYILWAWCTGSSTSDGRWPSFGFMQGSNANSVLGITVPFLSWNLIRLVLV